MGRLKHRKRPLQAKYALKRPISFYGDLVSRSIPTKENKLLFLLSGGICAFPGCNKHLVESSTEDDGPVVLGEIAHIIADSRQGPRGHVALAKEDRNNHANLILLCGDHHKIIDSQPNAYSIPVLQQMKKDHELRIRKITSPNHVEPQPAYKKEIIHSTLLSVTYLPQVVFATACDYQDDQESEVKKLIDYSTCRNQLVPFLLRGKQLWTFYDIRNSNNPFGSVINTQNIELLRSTDLWIDPEGKRRYVTLLNRALHKYAGRLKVRYDPIHFRYYFPVLEQGKERIVTYRPLKARQSSRKVVWQPKRKHTDERRNFWWHLAVGLKFHQVSSNQWCLSIRPERHLTNDGETPLPPEQIGRRVTRFKAHMYNDLYLAEVNFWRYYLSRGQPRIILEFGNQTAIIDAKLIALDVRWPGIPGDEKEFKNQASEEDLFTLSDLLGATSGEDVEWEESENVEAAE